MAISGGTCVVSPATKVTPIKRVMLQMVAAGLKRYRIASGTTLRSLSPVQIPAVNTRMMTAPITVEWGITPPGNGPRTPCQRSAIRSNPPVMTQPSLYPHLPLQRLFFLLIAMTSLWGKRRQPSHRRMSLISVDDTQLLS